MKSKIVAVSLALFSLILAGLSIHGINYKKDYFRTLSLTEDLGRYAAAHGRQLPAGWADFVEWHKKQGQPTGWTADYLAQKYRLTFGATLPTTPDQTVRLTVLIPSLTKDQPVFNRELIGYCNAFEKQARP